MTPHLTPLSSPLLAHCRMLKDKLGKDIEVVFVGPCIAKKLEADAHPELLSLSLSFGDIRQWFREAGIFPEEIRTSVYDKFVMTKAEEGTAYPIEGGMIETVKPYTAARNAYMMQVSGIQNIKRELAGLKAENFDRPVFIECLACHGGCVAGPCMSNRNPGFDKRLNILKHSDFSDRAGKREPQADISLQYGEKAVKDKEFGEAEIKRALAVIGKYGVEDELNCGGCGYDTCRNFARAMLSGKAEPEMCVSNMKQQAQRKANALLRCIPSPIVIADSRLNIIEYNDKFAETFWSEAEHGEIYERNDLRGADLRDFIDFTNLFSASLDLEQDIRREHVRFGDRLFDVVVFNIDKKQIVGGIIQDVTKMEMKKERIAEKAKDVIRKNLATIYSKKIPEERRVISILSDGLGSGVKANILSSMTTRMAMKFMEDNTDLLRSSEIMMDALPICQIRKISYATFSIVDSELEGKTRIFEMDNPRYIFIRNHRLLAIKGREFSSPKWKERTISVSQITTQPEDRIILKR